MNLEELKEWLEIEFTAINQKLNDLSGGASPGDDPQLDEMQAFLKEKGYMKEDNRWYPNQVDTLRESVWFDKSMNQLEFNESVESVRNPFSKKEGSEWAKVSDEEYADLVAAAVWVRNNFPLKDPGF